MQVQDMDTMMRWCISMSGQIDLDHTLRLADTLCVLAGRAGEECTAGLPVACQRATSKP